MPRVTQQQPEGWGPWRVCARFLPTVYNAPTASPLALPSLRRDPDRPPSDSPHRPYSPHRHSFPAPLCVSRRRCRVLHNSCRGVAGSTQTRRATLPTVRRGEPVYHVELPCLTLPLPCLSVCLPACLLACLLACLPAWLPTQPIRLSPDLYSGSSDMASLLRRN